MKRVSIWGLAWLGLCAVGCGSDAIEIAVAPPTTHTASFVGYVYDGAAGSRLSGYALSALALTDELAGTVDGDGRYTVGELSVWDDYTISITADGYRTFLSHNAAVGLPDGVSGDVLTTMSTHQTRHYDAYLFPSDLAAPAASLNIKTPIEGEAPSGKIRLRPISRSVLADAGDTPAGVPGQVWDNDEDLQAATVTQDFVNGQLKVSAATLVYGVTYRVDIWDVAGYQPLQGSYQAGVEADKTFTLSEEVHEPLVVVSSTVMSCSPPASPSVSSAAVVTIVFNEAIEAAASAYPGGNAEALDDGLSIVSPNADADVDTNTLRPDTSQSTQERGVAIAIADTTLVIGWDPSTGLLTSDAGDPITSVTYSNLGSVILQRKGSPASATTLSTLLGQATITCSL